MDQLNDISRQGRQVVAEAEASVRLSGRDDGRILVLGHRGAPATRCAENSVAAVTGTLRRGGDGVEVDVWLIPDGTLRCAHDIDGADLSALPTLPELLAAAQRPAGSHVFVEAKPVADRSHARRTAEALAAVIATSAGNATVTISSFDPRLLALIRRACADLPVRTALLGETSDPAPAVVRRAHEGGHDDVHLSIAAVRREPGAVRTARALGLGVSLWTVNAARDLRWAAELGVDAVITDDVPAARRELATEVRAMVELEVVAAA